MWDVVLDSLIDTLKILPILLVANFLIEYFEYKASNKIYHSKLLNGKLSPLFASAVGLVPQCGFSVVAANLFSSKKIAIGTLLAIFITTSDEAIPIMLSSGKSALMLVPLLLGKFALAIIVGYTLNFIYEKKDKRLKQGTTAVKVENPPAIKSEAVLVEAKDPVATAPTAESEKSESAESEIVKHADGEDHEEKDLTNHEHHEEEFGCHHHKIGESKKKALIVHPIVHSLIVSLYIFVATLIFGLIIYYIGQDKVAAFISSTKLFAPFLVALVGLIPNCASSVIISQCLVSGMISFGAAFAGLAANAGIAFVVLFKQNKNQKQNFLILGLLYAISAIVGFLIDLIF